MFTRFKQNIKTYPRTAMAVGSVYLGAVLGVIGTSLVMHLHLLTVVITCAEVLGFVALFDGLTYIWFMSDSMRLSVLLDALNKFEGRTSECDKEDCAVCDGEESNTDRDDLWDNEDGQDVAEYAVMLAVMLVIVIGVVRLIGGSANNVFSQIGSKIQ